MKIIGITGNSGTGKSILTEILSKKLNAKIIDADKIVKELSQQGEEYYNKIVENFGEQILDGNKINRKFLAQIIYNNDAKRQILNTLTQRYIVKKIEEEIIEYKKYNIVMDIPLLFESGLDKFCNVTISLIADEDIKIKRICERDKIDKSIAQQRLKIQKDDIFYLENSNYVIINNNADLNYEAESFIKILQNAKFLNDEIVMVRNGEIQYIQFRKLLKYKNIVNCFTLKPIDVGTNKTYPDKKEKIDNIYKKLCQSLGIDFKEIIRPKQSHTNIVKVVNDETGIYNEKFSKVDGLMTNKLGKVISLTVADCIAMYLFDKEKNVISVVHSGWEGTAKKIIKNAINEMKNEYGSKPEDIICAISPSIRQCHFEVKEDVKDIFYNIFKEMKDIDKIIVKGKENGKYNIDTVKININMLKEEGIPEQNIIDCNICSLCNSNLIHSYRKDGDNSGRNTAILALKNGGKNV